MRSFGSDNFSGVHPDVMDALERANIDHAPAYGNDPWTQRAKEKFQDEFGQDLEVVFVFGGTGANVVALSSITKPYHAVICSTTSHLWEHECGAPEAFTGCRLIPVESTDGKLNPELIAAKISGVGDEHMVQARVVSITQATELGLVYTPEEIQAIADFSHANNLLLHVDGARLGNAAVYLEMDLKECSRDLGIDVISFGGTKNGLMFGEALLFFNPELAEDILYLRKRATQLPSKMRYVSAQMEALLTDRLWHKNAKAANDMAALLGEKLKAQPGVELIHPVQANMVMATIESSLLDYLQQHAVFYVMDEDKHLARFVTSFDTKAEDINEFMSLFEKFSAEN